MTGATPAGGMTLLAASSTLKCVGGMSGSGTCLTVTTMSIVPKGIRRIEARGAGHQGISRATPPPQRGDAVDGTHGTLATHDFTTHDFTTYDFARHDSRLTTSPCNASATISARSLTANRSSTFSARTPSSNIVTQKGHATATPLASVAT